MGRVTGISSLSSNMPSVTLTNTYDTIGRRTAVQDNYSVIMIYFIARKIIPGILGCLAGATLGYLASIVRPANVHEPDWERKLATIGGIIGALIGISVGSWKLRGATTYSVLGVLCGFVFGYLFSLVYGRAMGSYFLDSNVPAHLNKDGQGVQSLRAMAIAIPLACTIGGCIGFMISKRVGTARSSRAESAR